MKTKENPLWAVSYVLIFLAIQVMAQTATLAVYSLFSDNPQGQLDAVGTIISMVVFSVAAIALFTLTGWSPVSRRYAETRPWDVLMWSVVAAIGAVIPSLFLQGLLPEWPEAIQKYIDEMEALAAQLMSTRGGYAVLCLLAPMAEELVFRGAALRTLLEWKPEQRWLMITLSALLFAVSHLNPAQLLHPFLIGLLLGWMYERTRSVLPGIIYHWANNTVAYLMYHAYPLTDITVTDIFGSETHALMAVAFSLLIIGPAIFQLHIHMKRLMVIAACMLSLPAVAEVKLPMMFADGMVLQQQADVRLWGWCDSFHDGTANRSVTVTTSWDGRSYTATSDSEGRFEVMVHTPPAGGPYEVTFNDGEQHRLSDVLIGEVWLCSGQSNMEMTMKGYKGQPVEGSAEELLQCGDSLLRLFNVGRATSLTPHRDVAGHWQRAQAASVRNFSATAYYFGRALRRTLGVPVGLVCTAYGGSACEAWMRADWLRPFCAPYRSPRTGYTVTLPQSDDDVKRLHQRCPTALYNGQLAPLVGYGIRGAIWYQGEDNVPRYDFYAELLKSMVEGWRADWRQGDFPFYYCQIAPYDYSLINWKDSQYLREQQLKAETLIPNARMAVLLDAGLEYGIHPRMKRQAGERLALLALGNTYAVEGMPDFATYSCVEFHSDTAVVTFDRSREWVYFEHGPHSTNFEIAGPDSVFHPADAWVNRNRVYVRSDRVKHPVAVRYAFRDWVVGDLMHDGLPVSSFRTDEW